MRKISRLTGEKKVFKDRDTYQTHLREIGVVKRNRQRDRRRSNKADISRVGANRREECHLYKWNTWEKPEVKPVCERQKISLIHPSRGRCHPSWECMNLWVESCSSHNDVEYIMSLDSDDYENYMDLVENTIGHADFRVVVNPNENVVQALNKGAEEATGDILIYVSDDFECPQNWDVVIQEAVQGKDDWVLHVNDGIQQDTATISILSRKYYERFGRIYHSGYISMWVDPDFTCEAEALGKLIKRMDITFKHNHYMFGGLPYDATYAKENSGKAWTHGEKLFYERQARNFDIPTGKEESK